MEIIRRVPMVLRVFGWTIEILSSLFAVLSVLTATPGDAPLPLVLLATLALVGVGEFCRTGASELRVEPHRRRIVGRMRTRFGTIPMSQRSVMLDANTQLAITARRVNGHEFHYLVAREQGKGRSVPLFSHPERDGADEVLGWVREHLGRLAAQSAVA